MNENFSSRSIDQWVLGLEVIIAMFTSKSLHSTYEVTRFKDNIYLRHMFTYYTHTHTHTHTHTQTPHSYIDIAKIRISEYYLPQFCVLFSSYSYLITEVHLNSKNVTILLELLWVLNVILCVEAFWLKKYIHMVNTTWNLLAFFLA